MKKLLIGLTLLASMSSFAADSITQSSTIPVYGKNCTIHINMDSNFTKESGLRTFGGAGSVNELQSIDTIKELINSRGYKIVENKKDAEFFLETSNGVQCVILEDGVSDFAQELSNLLATDYYLSGRFSGDGVENTFNKTIGGMFQKFQFERQVKFILNFCEKKY